MVITALSVAHAACNHIHVDMLQSKNHSWKAGSSRAHADWGPLHCVKIIIDVGLIEFVPPMT